MECPVKVAVFPVAGIGSRFLPVTKVGPKELLPIVDKPIIQFAVEEAVSAGIEHLIFVTSSTKRAVEDYFDTNFELEMRLEQAGKQEELDVVRSIIAPRVRFSYVRQAEPAGLGDAILCARHIIGDQPFAILLADDVIKHEAHAHTLRDMIAVYQQTKMSILGVQKIPLEDTDKYGIVALFDPIESMEKQAYLIKHIVEKPVPMLAPSCFGVVGRYILIPTIFDMLEELRCGMNGEIQLTDAIANLLHFAPVYAYPLQGFRFDCGSKMGFLQATIAYALERKELRVQLIRYLEKLHSDQYETQGITCEKQCDFV